jgi:hypothetical protein
MMSDNSSLDQPTEEQIRVNLMYPLKFVGPLLEQHGCKIEEEVLQEPLPFARLGPGDITYWAVFPPGTKREEMLPPLLHARKYRLTLPDGSIFEEYYNLDFHQSLIAQPLPPPR